MSYEDEGDGGDDDGRGKLVAVASFMAVHEAELARTKLVAEGIPAVVWDAATVAADPLLALALRGVKVAVPERDAARARLLLGPLGDVFEGRPRPAFRVRGTRGGAGIGVGAVIGLGVAAALAQVAPMPLVVIGGLGVPLAGWLIGERMRHDTCSGCLHPVPDPSGEGPDVCPRCKRALVGTIAHMNDRLDAEEALGLDEDEPEDDEDVSEEAEVDAPDPDDATDTSGTRR